MMVNYSGDAIQASLEKVTGIFQRCFDTSIRILCEPACPMTVPAMNGAAIRGVR
jgi:hypothetical protein